MGYFSFPAKPRFLDAEIFDFALFRLISLR